MGSADFQCIDGMLAFQPLPRKGLGMVIAEATRSDVLHVGVVHQVDGQCVVHEAIPPTTQDTPIDEFLKRSNGKVWYKIIGGSAKGGLGGQFAKDAADRFGAYDDKFRYGNGNELGYKYYCSEFVAIAARNVGIANFFGIDIKASWLDRSSPAVAEYLKSVHRIDTNNSIPDDWRIITPRDLLYSDQLTDPPFIKNASQNMPQVDVTPTHAVYDTLPGDTYRKKAAYLTRVWGTEINKVRTETDTAGGFTRYRFSIRVGDQLYSLVLFGQFADEQQLANEIKAKINAATR